MVQKIGSYLRILVCCSFALAFGTEVQLHMQLLDRNGSPTTSLVQGDRYTLRIIVESQEQLKDEVVVQGLDSFESAGRGPTSMQMTAVNGVVRYKRQLNYVVTASKLGAFTIGPATLQHAGSDYASEVLTYQVIEPSAQVKSENESDARLQIVLDKQQYYQGEAINLTVRFDYCETIYALALEPFTFKNFSLVPLGKPEQGSYTKNGNKCGFMEWRYQAVAKENGKLVIPSVEIKYQSVKERSNDNVLNMFQQFLGPTLQTHVLLSEPVSVSIDKLPAYAKDVDAVGIFRSLKLSSNTQQVAEGEPLTMRLELAGNGPMHFINLSLKDLPKSVAAYESKKTVETRNGQQIRVVEFVVQPMEQGEIVIPAQTMTFFNPAAAKVRTLQSESLHIAVTAPMVKNDYQEQPSDIQRLTTKALPALPLLICIVLSLVAALALWFWQQIMCVYRWAYYQFKRYRMWMLLRSRMRSYTTKKEYAQAWHWLVKFAALEEQRPLSEITLQDIEITVSRVIKQRERVSIFLALLSEATFGRSYDEQKLQGLAQQLFNRQIKTVLLLLVCGSTLHAHEISDHNLSQVTCSFQQAFNAKTSNDIQHALVASDGLTGDISLLDQIAFDWVLRLYFTAIKIMPLLYWQLLLIVMCIALLIVTYYKKLLLFFIIFSLTLALASIMAWHEYQRNGEYAIVAAEAPIRSGPGGLYAEFMSLQPYTLVRLLRQERDWSLIEMKHVSGWVKTVSLQLMRFD